MPIAFTLKWRPKHSSKTGLQRIACSRIMLHESRIMLREKRINVKTTAIPRIGQEYTVSLCTSGKIAMPPIISLISCSLFALLYLSSSSANPLFDVHLHYNAAHAAHYEPEQIIQKLEQNEIRRAVVTSTPAHLALSLYQKAPDRIVPLLGIYSKPADKMQWTRDPDLAERVEAALKNGVWRGIGELHLFADDRQSPVFRRIVTLAVDHDLPLVLHADPAVIDTVYEIAPGLPVIWAHAGTYPYPDLVADYLNRYPALHIDVSVRDERIATKDGIADDWYELFAAYPDRCMVGADTFSLSRWQDFDAAVARIRQWLALLPNDIGPRLAYDNAAAFFDTRAGD